MPKPSVVFAAALAVEPPASAADNTVSNPSDSVVEIKNINSTHLKLDAITSQEIEKLLPPVIQEIETTGFVLNTEILEKRIAYFTNRKAEVKLKLSDQVRKTKLKTGTILTRGRNRGCRLLELDLDEDSDPVDFENDDMVIATLNRIPGVAITSRSKLTLLDLAEKNKEAAPLCKLLIELNHCDAMIYNHGNCWRTKAVGGYLYPRHKPRRAATGRLTSDFQQWQRPERIPGVPELREILSPRPGMTFVYTDFSQIEIRIAAKESGDPWLLDVIKSGEDIHAMVIADSVCNNPKEFLAAYKDPSNPKHQQAVDLRSKYKGITFSILYGATARGIAENMHISLERAERIVTKFLSRAAVLKEYAVNSGKTAVATNQITTKRGFQRPFDPSVSTVGHIARQGMNTPIQSGCADLLKLSMIYMREEFRKPPYSDQDPVALLANSMHDEVIAQAYAEDAEIAKERMAAALSRAVTELFPGVEWNFLKDIKISEKWIK